MGKKDIICAIMIFVVIGMILFAVANGYTAWRENMSTRDIKNRIEIVIMLREHDFTDSEYKYIFGKDAKIMRELKTLGGL
ncbi:hypothetical protein AGMMS49940_15390 [Spirochaetia bacterium]|nr:hypothetical protein AGMMS49940_15390 [Spirochaetia bacterium]